MTVLLEAEEVLKNSGASVGSGTNSSVGGSAVHGTLAACPTVTLNSDTSYQETAFDSTG